MLWCTDTMFMSSLIRDGREDAADLLYNLCCNTVHESNKHQVRLLFTSSLNYYTSNHSQPPSEPTHTL